MTQSPFLRRSALVNGYALTLGTALLLWPVTTGIPVISVRYAWIVVALLCILASSLSASYFLTEKSDEPAVKLPWIFILAAAALVGWYGASIPYLEFSDEILIALPGYTVVHLLIAKMGWIPLLLGTWIAFWLAKAVTAHMQWRLIAVIVVLMAGFGFLVAASGMQSGIALRYPPLVHLVQIVTTILSGANPSFYRLPNALWTALLIVAVWKMLPEWKLRTKLMLLACIVFGPFGWTYRTVLFQACGELTIAFVAITLLTTLLTPDKQNDRTAVLLGMIFAGWFLYRPSSLSSILAAILVLLALPRTRRSGFITASIAGPIVACWLLLSPYYTFSYSLSAKVALGTVGLIEKMIAGVVASFIALPHNQSVPVLSMIVASSILAFIFVKPAHRRLLAVAWGIALINGIMQNAVINDVFYGVPRYNVLLLLPFGLSFALISDFGTGFVTRTFWKGLTLAGVALLILLTPFDFTNFTQQLRAQSPDIYRTPTEGYLASPLYLATKELLKTTRSFAIVTPGSEYLDLFVAQGLLTSKERSAIMERSNAWTLTAHPVRPVIVQGPITTSYQPNLTPEHEEMLRKARAWALTQTGSQVFKIGLEEAIIVR